MGLDRSWPGKNVVTLPPPAARRPSRLCRLVAASAGAVSDIRRQLQRRARKPVHGRGRIRAHHRLRANHVLRRHARAAAHATDRRRRRPSRAGHRSGRVGQSDRRTVRRPGRRPAVPALRHVEAGHARAAREEPRILRATTRTPFTTSGSRIRTDRPGKNRTFSFRCPRTGCGRMSTWTTGRAAARSLSSTDTSPRPTPTCAPATTRRLHNARWSGLILWWQDLFGKLPVASSGRTLTSPTAPGRRARRRPSLRTVRRARAPEKIEDAAQEFLTDWLVRRQYDQALEFLSPQAYALPEPERRCEETSP